MKIKLKYSNYRIRLSISYIFSSVSFFDTGFKRELFDIFYYFFINQFDNYRNTHKLRTLKNKLYKFCLMFY
jgi:hypothetical protein